MQRTARSCSAKVSTAGFIEGGWPTGLVPCWDAVKYLRHSSVRIAHLDHQPPDVFVYKPVPLCSGSKGRQSTLGFLFRGPKAFESHPAFIDCYRIIGPDVEVVVSHGQPLWCLGTN